MNKGIILLSTFLIIILLMKCNEYNSILSDTNIHSYYLAINIKYDNNTIPIVIENAELFSMYDTINLKKFKKKILKSLKTDTILEINSKDRFDYLKKYEVKTIQNIEEIRLKGEDVFLNTFFDNNVQKVDLKPEEKRYLIYILFNWNIFVKDDDETGYLIIPGK